MKKLLPIAMLLMLCATAFAQAPEADPGVVSKIKTAIEQHLGRPYVWGSSGLKSFDCSGFLWRVMFDSGILVKRTTARKFYMMLPKVDDKDKWNFGTVIFFDNLEHVGIVDSKSTFYQAQVSVGTNLSKLDPFWRPKVFGFRALPIPGDK